MITQRLKSFLTRTFIDKSQVVKISSIEDFARTPVPYEQRVINENITFDTKPRDEETGNEIAIGNDFVIEYLLLERKLSAYKGQDLWKYVENFVNKRDFTKILSIGSGPAAVEMEIARNFKSKYQLDCIDLNKKLIEFATEKAQKQGMNLHPLVADINSVDFKEEYDLIMVVAALHHFVELEKVFININKALKKNGEFVAYEPVCRSGMFLFRRQRLLLSLIFLLLPARYRVNHQDYPGEKRIDRLYHEYDRSGWTFECIRSGDIPELLKAHFKIKHWGRGMTFLRRVSDSLYGPNYDYSHKGDRYLAKILCYLDRLVRFFHILPIEGLFFIGKKKSIDKS